MPYLYHGSVVQGLTQLEPRKRFTPSEETVSAAIYATPLPAFAATHAFPWSSDEGFDIELKDGKVSFMVPRVHAERLSIPISIYKVSSEGFVQTEVEQTGQTWHAITPVPVLEETQFSSVKEAFASLGVTIRFVDV